MPDDQQSTAPQPTHDAQPTPHTGFAMKKVLVVGVVFIVILIIGIVTVLALSAQRSNQTTDPTPTGSTEPTPTVQPTSDIAPGTTYIAYIRDNNIWLVDTRGTQHQQLTENTSQSVRYQQLRWLDTDTISYVKCTATCGIYSLALATKQETTLVPETLGYTAIYGYDVQEDDQQVAYTYLTPDNTKLFIMLLKDDVPTPVKEVPFRTSTPTALIDLNQQALVRFSPDGTHLMVINTDTQPNAQQVPHTLWVFNVDTGTEIFAIGRQNTLVTFGTWLDDQTLLFKYGTDIIRKNILHQGETLLGSLPESYDLSISNDRQTFVYWTYAQAIKSTALSTYSLETKNAQPRTAHFYKPQWFDPTRVVALQTRQAEQELPALFETDGRLMMLDITTNAVFELVADGVTAFSIRPSQ